MTRYTVVIVAILTACWAGASGPSLAALYAPDDTALSLPVGDDGKPRALPFEEFQRRIAGFKNMRNPEVATEDRIKLLRKIETRLRNSNRTQLETVTLAVDLIQAGRDDEAETLLAHERRGYLPNATLAHIYADKHDWAKAYDYLDIANGERPPKELPGLTRQQLGWQIELDRGPLATLFQSRWHESRNRIPIEDEGLDALFPVKFVNAAGVYEPGNLAPAEAAKLPADAIAITQQLALWFPNDTRLFWLLGELYAVEGRLDVAARIMDECVRTRQYGNRKLLRQHREVVLAARGKSSSETGGETPLVATPAAPPASGEPAEQPREGTTISMKTIWIYFGAIGAIALFALIRAIARRHRGDCGPVG